jgi:hypothetical protein
MMLETLINKVEETNSKEDYLAVKKAMPKELLESLENLLKNGPLVLLHRQKTLDRLVHYELAIMCEKEERYWYSANVRGNNVVCS